MPCRPQPRLGQHRQQPDDDDENAGPVVIVFRPGDIIGIAVRNFTRPRHESGGGFAGAGLRLRVQLRLQRRQGQRVMIR